MTRGEKIAWIWVWSVIAVVSATLAFATWRIWRLSFVYIDARICENSK